MPEAKPRDEASRVLPAAVVLLTFASTAAAPPQNSASPLPPRLTNYLAGALKLTAAERRRLDEGAPVTRLLDADESKEVAVFGAIWIDAPAARYVELLNDIATFERGPRFRITRRISTPPRLEDFADLRLPEQDAADLRSCQIGDCEIKLGEHAIARIRAEIDWKRPDARRRADLLLQRITLDAVNDYRERGNSALPVYRDRGRPLSVAEEFRAIVDQMPELSSHFPAVRRSLLDYPLATVAGSSSFMYWQETSFGLKPTLRVSHLTIQEGAEETVVTSKMLYATHYFRAALEMRVLVADPSRGRGFWFITVNRSRLDGLSGFGGLFVRRRVRSDVLSGTLTSLRGTKQMLERSR